MAVNTVFGSDNSDADDCQSTTPMLNQDVLVLLMEHLPLDTLLGLGRVCYQWYLARNFVLHTKKYLCLAAKVNPNCLQPSTDPLCVHSSMHRFFNIDHQTDFEPSCTIVSDARSASVVSSHKADTGTVSCGVSLAQVLVNQLPRIERLTIHQMQLSTADLLLLLRTWASQLTELRLLLCNDHDQVGIAEWEAIFVAIASMPRLTHLSLLVRNNQLDPDTHLQSVNFTLLIPAIRRLEELYLGFDDYHTENRRTVLIDLCRSLDLSRLRHWGLGFFHYDEHFYQVPLFWSVSDIVTHTVEHLERRAPALLSRLDRVKLYYRPWQFAPQHLNTDSFPEFGQFWHRYDGLRQLEVGLFCARVEQRFIATLATFTELHTLVLHYHYEVSGDSEKFALHPSCAIERYPHLPSVRRLFVQRALAHSPMLPKIFVNARIIPY